MKDQIYNIELLKLNRQVLPTFMRTCLILKILDSALRPLLDLCRWFAEVRLNATYKLTHTGQVCYLQAALNDTFDLQERRIKIEEVVRRDYVVLYPSIDNKYVDFAEDTTEHYIAFYPDKVVGVGTIDFIVKIPKELYNEEIQIKNIVNYYKLASKRYRIENIIR